MGEPGGVLFDAGIAALMYNTRLHSLECVGGALVAAFLLGILCLTKSFCIQELVSTCLYCKTLN